MEGPSPVVELRGITKRFPGVLACDRVDLQVYSGEIHVLFGENGAGKSTLMKILYGQYQPEFCWQRWGSCWPSALAY